MRGINLLHPHPALLLSDGGRKHLIISDLHIGLEEKYTKLGVNIQASVETMSKILFTLLEEQRPDQLIIIGDIKYSINKIGSLERREIPQFLEVSKQLKTIVVPGNHDGALTPLLPRNVTLSDESYLLIGENCLLHGHTKLPRELAVKRIIMGHIHPRYDRNGNPLTGRSIWLLLKVEKALLFKEAKDEDLEICVLPAFNKELSSGRFYTERRIISPILRKVRGSIREALIMTLEGDILGGLESIDYVL